MKLSIIIISWNTCALLHDCLALLAQSIVPETMEVFVVDNASGDGSARMVAEHFAWVKLIQLTENIGFGRANNLANTRAAGEYRLFLNPDTLVPAGTLAGLVQMMDAAPEVGALGPRIANPDGSPQHSIHPRPTLFREAWRLLHLDRLYPLSRYPDTWLNGSQDRLVDVLMGACILIRGSVIEQVGLFDEQFFMFSEEVDLCERIRGAGWCIRYTPRASITHFGGQSTAQAADAMFLELYRNKVKYFRKHHGSAAAGWYKRILWLVSLPRVALFMPGRGRQIRRQYRRLLAELRGF